MVAPRIGSVFSGSGQLDRAVEQATGGRVVWQSETDRGACRVLAQHWPDVPNLGDIRYINWSRVRWGIGPIDILCGGFPCTDISFAGRQQGLGPGTQSGLWTHMARAIDTMRPPRVIIENVRALLHVPAQRAGGHLESDTGDVAVDGVTLRGLGAVLGDLANLGYDADWEVVSAAAVGAPHRRDRVFIHAHTAAHADRL